MAQVTLGEVTQIAAGEMPEATIEEVYVNEHYEFGIILWKNGVSYPVEVTSGKGWEIGVKYRIYSPTGGYAAFVTIVSTLGNIYNGNKFLTGGIWYDQTLEIQMPVMPTADVTINRLKIWTCNAFTDNPPEESKW